MKVLIVENEIYLAQSISMKLADVGYECDIVGSFNELNTDKYYDIVLLSASTSNFLKVVEKFKNSIVILLISYISTDTVSNPLNIGASDYIQKPFMIEELVRKIKHYQHFKKISSLNNAYKNYIKSRLETIQIPEFNYKKIKLPLIIKADKQILADTFVFNYINECDISFSYINLSTNNAVYKALKQLEANKLLFLSNFQVLNANEKEKLLSSIKDKNVILHTNSNIQDSQINVLNFSTNEKNMDNNEILTIDEYVKYIILTYQNVFPDTDLSKKLGISRKSLWEKRKKYGFSKKR
ncbi:MULTISPECIES: response regulator [unclassified Campylobacter]|uniref:response regulator n=1 Tax=unclassified Campylobacter TaxID=2593542 RepID=UPI001237E14E|nr:MULTISPECIES: response regulator [unclassified Campylobacter]KAA6227245.1 response regulator [Campylobacter sp. LR286c]KAA6228290.1 response regulator [Campylobacter sp. LR196d]KAA6229292.1 response regulator [Campylobacter sp. LR291e]